MSNLLNTYSFLPWLRSVLVNSINAYDMDEDVKLRAEISVPITIEGQPVDGNAPLTQTIDKKIQLYGPGDIVGIDSQTIVKTEPLDKITNFEPNYLPYIDFYDEDFPWRYTPAAPDTAKDRLRPWIILIVLDESEFKEGKNIKDKPLPYIQLESEATSIFPPAGELWAWAHVHVNEGLMDSIVAASANNESVISKFKEVLREDPDLAYSRILCPRKLAPNTSYHAFLVPVYETGRLAGLGLDPGKAPFATLAGWEAYAEGTKESPSHYPYYHRWYFRTSAVGDFEYLVRLLEPQPMDSRVGKRDMDVQQPGYNIKGISDPELNGILRLGGALQVPEEALNEEEKNTAQKYDNWDSAYPHPFQSDLAGFVNLQEAYTHKNAAEANTDSGLEKIAGDPDPLITPPIYGQWHALTNRLLTQADGSPAPNRQNWLHNMNLDPRYRVSAGFGTRVVQDNQENYMNAAWKQIGDVLEANRQMRQSQLALESTKIWYHSHLSPVRNIYSEKAFRLTSPLQARVLTHGLTVKGHIKQSLVPEAMTSTTVRRITRPKGRMNRMLPFSENIHPFNLFDRINKKEVRPVAPKALSPDLPTHDKIAEENAPTGLHPRLAKWLLKNKWLEWVLIALALIILLLIWMLKPGVPIASIGGGVIAAILGLIWYMIRQLRKLKGYDAARESSMTPDAVDDMPRSPNFKITAVGDDFRPRRLFWDNKESTSFKRGLKDAFTLMEASREVAYEPPKKDLKLDDMISATFTAIDPALTIPRLIKNRVFIPGFILDNLFEEFTEAMAYPEFDTPMYRPLVNISTELFLPNIQYVPQNSITLLESNQEFIEAYMVGLNHEFARELLWREYPTDQRGSYFRQFWDVSSFYDDDADLNEEEMKEKLRDIPPIHKWSRSSELGDHDHREEGRDNEEELVLVIRGELLKKYPNAVIYAHKAKWQREDGEINNEVERQLVELTAEEEKNPPKSKVKTPLYEARVDPDIHFFGFDLTAGEAKGGSGEPGDQEAGWFFVIKERPGEPRFGLDIGTEENLDVWNDLSWGRLMGANGPGSFIQIKGSPSDLNLTEPNPADESEKIAQHKEDVHVQWSENMNAAEMAYILYQSPVMVAVHASEML